MTSLSDSMSYTFPQNIKYLISDIDGVLTTEDKKSIAPGIQERLAEIKDHGILIIANTLRGIVKYQQVIDNEMQEVIDFGISERGAIQIDSDRKIIPLLTIEDIKMIEEFDDQIQEKLLAKGATKGAGPYTCVKYYFADNATCTDIVSQMEAEQVYRERNNDLILEATGQGSIILTKKGVDKAYGITKTLGQKNLKKTMVIGDDRVDESMFLLPGVVSYNVGRDKTLQASYTTSKIGYEATIEILDALIKTFGHKIP